jgi:hypothetical protein
MKTITPRARHLISLLEGYFLVQELVTKELYGVLGDNAICVFEEPALLTLIQLRKFFNRSFIINDWCFEGTRDGHGFRDNTEDTGSAGSMHRLALAFDPEIHGVTASEARKRILANQYLFPHLRRLEDDVDWLHFDLKETYLKEIYLFKA